MYKLKNKKLEKVRGITLIALVITIIVLLILAGVSIAMLTGQNGLLTQASDAKTKTEKAEVVERAQTDILGYMAENQNGEITTKQLKDVLSKYFESVPGEDKLENKLKEEDFKLKSKPEYGGQEIEIADIYGGGLTDKTEGTGGETFDENELTIGVEKATNTEKYGWKVKNYNVQYDCVTGTSNVWRLFYQDTKYTYLIADELVGSYMPSDYYGSYTDMTKMSIVGQKLNGRISSLFTNGNMATNLNLQATAWFTDTENEEWKKYKDKNGDAEFCIASPTAELFEASYNKNTNTTHDKYKGNILNVQLGDSGYEDNTSEDWFSTEDSHGIYNNGMCWLASPSNHSSDSCLDVVEYVRLVRLQLRGQRLETGPPNSLYSYI